jgi:Putative transposase.
VKYSKRNRKLIDSLFKEYPPGFYVYAKDKVKGKKNIAKYIGKYIGRYIRHPAIANSRIESYDTT